MKTVKKKMTVNINNLRKQAAYSLDSVIHILNDGIMPETAYQYHDVDGEERCFEGDILVSKDNLNKHINSLRMFVSAILCIYEENNPDFKDLSEEVEIIEFNPLKEEKNSNENN
jgi:hypothetical protein